MIRPVEIVLVACVAIGAVVGAATRGPRGLMPGLMSGLLIGIAVMMFLSFGRP